MTTKSWELRKQAMEAASIMGKKRQWHEHFSQYVSAGSSGGVNDPVLIIEGMSEASLENEDEETLDDIDGEFI